MLTYTRSMDDFHVNFKIFRLTGNVPIRRVGVPNQSFLLVTAQPFSPAFRGIRKEGPVKVIASYWPARKFIRLAGFD